MVGQNHGTFELLGGADAYLLGRDKFSSCQLKLFDNVKDIASLVDKSNMSVRIAMSLKSNVIIHRPVGNFKHTCKVLNNNIKVLFFEVHTTPSLTKMPTMRSTKSVKVCL